MLGGEAPVAGRAASGVELVVTDIGSAATDPARRLGP